MAQMIARAGFELHVWARRPETLQAIEQAGAVPETSLKAMARSCQLVGVCVVDDADLEAVVLGDNLLAGMAPGGIVAVHSTVHPDTCRRLAQQAEPHGVTLLDAPVSGGAQAALSGTLAVMVGGDPEAFEAARGVFEAYGDPVRWVGEPGTGQLCKLVNNLLFTANIKLASQALEMGEALGIDPAALAEVLPASSGRSFALDTWMRLSQAKIPMRVQKLLHKDVKLARDAAERGNVNIGALSNAADQALELLSSETRG